MDKNKTLKNITKIVACSTLLGTLALSVPAKQINAQGATVETKEGTATVTKTYQSGEKLGLPSGAGRSNWHFRTYHQVFVGWSTSATPFEDGSKIYRDIDTIDTVVASEGDLTGKVLHPIFAHRDEIFSRFANDIESASSKLAISVNQTDRQVVPNTNIRSSEGFTGEIDTTNRKVVAYFDETKEKHYISISSTFGWNDRHIPFLVTENPLSSLKGPNGVTDFTGANPTTFTYEDLLVELDPNVETSEEMKNLEFTSALFTVGAVLDENFNELQSTITKPGSNEFTTRFSFANPNKVKKFYIRAVLRNYGDTSTEGGVVAGSTVYTATSKDVLSNMTLTSGDAENLYVTREKALEFAKSETRKLEFIGSIGGKIVVDKTNLNGSVTLPIIGTVNPADFLPNEFAIKTNNSLNSLEISFGFNKVTYFDNKPSNNVELGTSNVVHNSTLVKDVLNTNTLPTGSVTGDTHLATLANFEENGVNYEFVGWNTSADGSGMSFDENTVVNNDITVYAQWRKVEDTKDTTTTSETPINPTNPDKSENPVDSGTKQPVDTSDLGVTSMPLLSLISLAGIIKLRKNK